MHGFISTDFNFYKNLLNTVITISTRVVLIKINELQVLRPSKLRNRQSNKNIVKTCLVKDGQACKWIDGQTKTWCVRFLMATKKRVEFVFAKS